MSARTWTSKELREVWPVDGWDWVDDGFGHWGLRRRIDRVVVYWHEVGGLACTRPAEVLQHQANGAATWKIPHAVVLAVIGVHLGHDSPEWMASEAESRASEFDAGAAKCKRVQDKAAGFGVAQGIRTVVEMLRRRRAEP